MMSVVNTAWGIAFLILSTNVKYSSRVYFRAIRFSTREFPD